MFNKKRLILLIVTVLIFLLFATYLLKVRYQNYNYDTDQEAHYIFDKHEMNILKVDIIDNSVIIHDYRSNDKNSTVLLKVQIKSTLLGKIFKPHIELYAESKSLIQNFEYGAEGTRYLNISSLVHKGIKEIHLDPKYIILENTKIELISFTPPTLQDKRILIIAPHPDDAEIAAYGLYSKYAKNIYIATITAGENGETIYNSFVQNYSEQKVLKGKKRTIESLTVPLLGG